MRIDINRPVGPTKEIEKKYSIKIIGTGYNSADIIGKREDLKNFLIEYEMSYEEEIIEIYPELDKI